MQVWAPNPQNAESSHVKRLMETINRKYNVSLSTYEDLHKWSITNWEFWQVIADFLEISFSQRASATVRGDAKALYPPPSFFPDSKLNYAENCLEGRDPSDIALITAREGATSVKHHTMGELKEMVHALACALTKAGVTSGDRVAGIVCNSKYSITLAMATASLGAIYSSTAPDMGTSGILDRLLQIEPKVVFFDNASLYNRKIHDLLEKAQTVLKRIDSNALSAFVVLPNIESSPLSFAHPKAIAYADFITKAKGMKFGGYVQVPFTHPLFVMYSSGTTGPPKCIVHSHGGILVQEKKEQILQSNMSPGDVYFQYTTTGWMMWQYLITALASKVTIVLLDGSPMTDLRNLIKFLDVEGVTHFGTSPRWLAELKAQNIKPKDIAKLDKLRVVTSTGSVLVSDLYYWFYTAWPKEVQLASVSGGTDLMACFFIGNPIQPVHAGQLQCLALGMDVRIYSSEGTEVKKGDPGELVCTRAFPSQPIYFLSDPSGSKYKEAYYTKFQGAWHHGDFVQIEPETNGITMLGRSDGVLNPSGVRFGSAEIYHVTEKIPEIADSVCVGQRRKDDIDEQVLLFVIPREKPLSPSLVDKIKKQIQKETSPRHVPKYVVEVEAIPYTVNGKKVELVIKQIVSGGNPKVSATIANPECLSAYKKFVEIEKVLQQGNSKL